MISPLQLVKELNFVRTAGSQEEKKGFQILENYLDKFGIGYKEEPFELHAYLPGEATINAAGKTFTAYPFGLTESANIEGELVFIENPESLIYNKRSYKGKVIIGNKYSNKIHKALKRCQAEAYFSIGRPLVDANTRSYRQKIYEEGYVPCLSIDYKQGAKLSRLEGKKISIKIKQKVDKKQTHNLIADIPGTGNDENIIYAVAHFDTVARAPGASDNTGGSVTLLKIAEYFAEHKPERALKLIWFSGEEMGLLGSQNYVKKHLDEIKDKAGIVFNIDVTGDDLGHNIYKIIGSKELLGYIDGLSKEKGFMYNAKLDIYSSDGMPFSRYEIPSVNLARFGGQASANIHTKNDHVRYVTRRGLDTTVDTAIYLIKKIANANIFPVKREIDSSLKDKIEQYLWNLTFEEPELEWTPKYKKD
ncbi:MAG: M20/M25/M40 family metallo-hydrolase [Candidatus Cloacimonetes bacterium]|nr:M20/M25/M40 family metallo-hydrolase [Candidatus Cloacimonadota bacterium]